MQLALNASLGIALAEEGHDSGTLMQHADLAMYHAKRTRTGLAFYEAAEHDGHARERLELLSQLRPAIEHGQLRVHYQPKVSLHDGAPFGVEALVRWDHPDKGLLAAGRFVDLAEHSGVMLDVTKVVLDTALADFWGWRRGGLQLELAINLSASLLHDESVASMILRRLRAAGVPAREIVLEITETALLTAPTVARRSLEALSHAGVRISLDDFGTGHSSLSHLRQYPISELKIDKSFVDGAVRDDRDRGTHPLDRRTRDSRRPLGHRRRHRARRHAARPARRRRDAWTGLPVCATHECRRSHGMDGKGRRSSPDRVRSCLRVTFRRSWSRPRRRRGSGDAARGRCHAWIRARPRPRRRPARAG